MSGIVGGNIINILFTGSNLFSSFWAMYNAYNQNSVIAIILFIISMLLALFHQLFKKKNNIANIKSLHLPFIITIAILSVLTIFFLICPRPFSLENWWKKTLKSDKVICMVPSEPKVDIYPSAALSPTEREERITYSNAFVDDKDTITILGIEKNEKGKYAVKIQYSTSVGNKEGYVDLKKIIDVNTETPITEAKTYQTTRIYWQPTENALIRPLTSKPKQLTQIARGEKIYLLEAQGSWQQILYNNKYRDWSIFWVRKDELVAGKDSFTVKKNGTVFVRSKPEASDFLASINPGEVYTIWEVSNTTQKRPAWYRIYTHGVTGWVNAQYVTVNK